MCTYGITHLNGNDVPVMCKTHFLMLLSYFYLFIVANEPGEYRSHMTNFLLWSS